MGCVVIPDPKLFLFKRPTSFRFLAKTHVLPKTLLLTVGHLLLKDFSFSLL